jgi:hypothetical protein
MNEAIKKKKRQRQSARTVARCVCFEKQRALSLAISMAISLRCVCALAALVCVAAWPVTLNNLDQYYGARRFFLHEGEPAGLFDLEDAQRSAPLRTLARWRQIMRHPRSGLPLFIVDVKNATILTHSAETVASWLRTLGFVVTHSWLGGAAAALPRSFVEHLLRNEPGVELWSEQPVFSNAVPIPQRVGTCRTNSLPWGLDRVDQRDLPLDGSFEFGASSASRGVGRTTHVVIFDTGVNGDHEDLCEPPTPSPGCTSRLVATCSRNFMPEDLGTGPSCAIKSNWWEFYYDHQHHGSHCAGSAAGLRSGVSKASRLCSIRVLGADGSGSTAGSIAGADYLAAIARDDYQNGGWTMNFVASMSLGGDANPPLDRAVNRLATGVDPRFPGRNGPGVVTVVAAGNEDMDACQVSPARAAFAITVGATNASDARADFSNYGSCVDIMAPGVDVESIYMTGLSQTETFVISGTSMATPHVAGAAALYWEQNPLFTAPQIEDLIFSRSTCGRLQTHTLKGSPNVLLYVGSDDSGRGAPSLCGACVGASCNTVRRLPRPANDECATPIALTWDNSANLASAVVVVPLLNASATSFSAGDSCLRSGQPDVWYTFTAPAAGTYTFSTCNSVVHTVISLHTSCPSGSNANSVACSDGSSACYGPRVSDKALQSVVSRTMAQGDTLRVRVSVWTYQEKDGLVQLTVSTGSCTPPAANVAGSCGALAHAELMSDNDLCSNARLISGTTTMFGATMVATKSSQPPIDASGFTPQSAPTIEAINNSPDVWFRRTGSTSGAITVCSSEFRPVISLHTSCTASTVAVDQAGSNGCVQINAGSAFQYYRVSGSAPTDRGVFTLEHSVRSAVPQGPTATVSTNAISPITGSSFVATIVFSEAVNTTQLASRIFVYGGSTSGFAVLNSSACQVTVNFALAYQEAQVLVPPGATYRVGGNNEASRGSNALIVVRQSAAPTCTLDLPRGVARTTFFGFLRCNVVVGRPSANNFTVTNDPDARFVSLSVSSSSFLPALQWQFQVTVSNVSSVSRLTLRLVANAVRDLAGNGNGQITATTMVSLGPAEMVVTSLRINRATADLATNYDLVLNGIERDIVNAISPSAPGRVLVSQLTALSATSLNASVFIRQSGSAPSIFVLFADFQDQVTNASSVLRRGVITSLIDPNVLPTPDSAELQLCENGNFAPDCTVPAEESASLAGAMPTRMLIAALVALALTALLAPHA